MSVTMKRGRAWTRMKVRLRVIDMFSSLFLLFFLFPEKSQTAFQIWQKNKKPNPPCMHIKKLLVKEVLTLRQSFQAEVVQNHKKKSLLAAWERV